MWFCSVGPKTYQGCTVSADAWGLDMPYIVLVLLEVPYSRLNGFNKCSLGTDGNLWSLSIRLCYGYVPAWKISLHGIPVLEY